MTKECNIEHCNAMPKEELNGRLDGILEAIKELKDDIKEIKDDTRSHYKSILEQGKDIEYLEKEYEEMKQDIKDRDKKNRWLISIIAPFIAAVVAGIVSYFSSGK